MFDQLYHRFNASQLNKSSLHEQLNHLYELRKFIPDIFEQTLKNDLIVCLGIKIMEEESTLLTQVYLFNGQAILNADSTNETDLAVLDKSVIKFSQSLITSGLAFPVPNLPVPPPATASASTPIQSSVPFTLTALKPLIPPNGGGSGSAIKPVPVPPPALVSESAAAAAPVPFSTTLVPDNTFVLYSVDGKAQMVLPQFDASLVVRFHYLVHPS